MSYKIKRFSDSSRYVTLYHVTKKENIPSIKREGLKTKYYKQREYHKYMGIKDTGIIYFTKDKSKLVKPLKDDRYVLITVKIPIEVYNRMDKIEGDPEYWASNQDANTWKELVAESFRKTYPEKFGKMSTKEIMKDATPFEYGSPDNCVCIRCDIPKEYIYIDEPKIKRFSTLGRFGAGLKGAAKTGIKGALYGGVLAPGNGLALVTGHGKIAAGLTGVGALVGAGIGSKFGWEEGVSSYDYNNDPEYRKNRDKEERELIMKQIKESEEEDLIFSKSFKYSSWVKVKEAPKEFLDYVKFYENIWSKKIKTWYKSMDLKGLEPYPIPEFKEFFPIPYNSETSEKWLKEDQEYLCLATFNSAGDDGWLCYNPIDKRYGVDLPDETESIKEVLLRNLKHRDSYYHLSPQQKRLVSEFKTKILSL